MGFEAAFVLVGHRGAAGLAPENTLASFQLALDLGADALELDVYRVENELIVLHDETLDRTTNGRGRVGNCTLAELRQLDAGNGEKIPLLTEVFSLISPEIGLNIELKGENTAKPLSRLLSNYPQHDVLVSSFNLPELARFRELDHKTPVAPVFNKPHRKMLEIAQNLSAWSIHLSRRMMNEEVCNLVRHAGFEVLVWTVNEVEEGLSFREMGAKGIFTDFPDRLARVK